MIRAIHILVNVPKEVHPDRLAGYVLDAVKHWGGQFDPDNDPLFYGVDIRKLKIGSTNYEVQEKENKS